jgi:hypothetical protein
MIDRSRQALSSELAAADFGDGRLTRRLQSIVDAVAEAPARSFPDIAKSEGELEAVYRFLSNERVTYGAILEPHLQQTTARCAEKGEILVVHDTTEFFFRGIDGAREGLGYLQRGARGYQGHVALAVQDPETRTPLGLVGFEPLVKTTKPVKSTPSEYSARSAAKPLEAKRSYRWVKLVDAVDQRLAGKAQAIHIMDREADAYSLWGQFATQGSRFVIRAKYDRQLNGSRNGDGLTVGDILAFAHQRLEREIPVERRKPRRMPGRIIPARSARLASLSIRAARIRFAKPESSKAKVPAATVNVVEVFEKAAPPGEEPIRWVLLTTEPIDTWEDCARVVDIYRARWVIEEFFKALKTGCAYERRQLMSLHALQNAFALLAPIAWRILLLRTLARDAPQGPASELSSDEVDLLRTLSRRVAVPPNPTNEQVLNAIAGLGGHLKRNGPPGWQTIGRGYEKFLAAFAGWAAARCDQS